MFKLVITLFFLILFQASSHAYIGPGMGGGILAATIGIIVAFFALLFGILWFPLKRLIKKIKKQNNNEEIKETNQNIEN